MNSSVFSYQDGVLCAESVPLPAIAEHYGTPTYVYSRKSMEDNWRAFDEAFGSRPHLVCYAVKANSNLAVLSLLARLGSGFDVVSTGELQRVIAAGGDPKRVIFAGAAKRADEIAHALEHQIRCFNVESVSELSRINTIAGELGCVAPVALRVNPDVDARTHPYIATGLAENKFGIPANEALDAYARAVELPHLKITGIACHIGSQLTELAPLRDAIAKVMDLVGELNARGITLSHVDVGGGLGICYQDERPPSIAAYAEAVIHELGDGHEILLEPGRAVVGNAGLLLNRIEYLKSTGARHFALIDGAMNDLLRPALYGAWQEIRAVKIRDDVPIHTYDVVGPVCETGDLLGRDRELKIAVGDLLAVMSAGAYGFTMSSQYNSRPRAAEILVDGAAHYQVRARESIADLMCGETLAPLGSP